MGLFLHISLLRKVLVKYAEWKETSARELLSAENVLGFSVELIKEDYSILGFDKTGAVG